MLYTTPRSTEDALRWQQLRIGSAAWEGWPLKFQRMAFGYYEESGWLTAAEGLNWMREHDRLSLSTPPRGGLAWFESNDRVTVFCGVGDGRVIGPGVAGVVGLAVQTDLTGYRGWSPAVFPFAR
ncbi:hypothetical protein GCM10009841_06380 [Microlunatus panaciterrae]|uniref:Uncharacterized protein n=1 Tax=Microlunatus panaciterrae TaxID=400768 RepID=A0ABS2RJ66_9ACTN|nr:hypothetical protein [Microlunatus panaciterrae]MBM7798708.1 hypothetical protein [Microlunatus panaciterrae]